MLPLWHESATPMLVLLRPFRQTAPLRKSRIAIRDAPPPEKRKKGQFGPFLLSLQAQHSHSILKAIPGLKMATDMVANATTISFTIVAAKFPCVDDQ